MQPHTVWILQLSFFKLSLFCSYFILRFIFRRITCFPGFQKKNSKNSFYQQTNSASWKNHSFHFSIVKNHYKYIFQENNWNRSQKHSIYIHCEFNWHSRSHPENSTIISIFTIASGKITKVSVDLEPQIGELFPSLSAPQIRIRFNESDSAIFHPVSRLLNER